MGVNVDETTGGRTRWRVFGLVLVAGSFGVVLMFTGLSQGAIAASFAVAGTSYKASADKLDAQGSCIARERLGLDADVLVAKSRPVELAERLVDYLAV